MRVDGQHLAVVWPLGHDANGRTIGEVPTMSMFNASNSVFEIGLNALSALLDKARPYAEA